MTHHCHAIGCANACNPEFLMCPSHWLAVPKRTQYRVLRYYHGNLCKDLSTNTEWSAVADEAVAWVAYKEGKISQETLNRIVNKTKKVMNKQPGGDL